MTKDGYPSKKELKKIREWPYEDTHGLFEFIRDLWKYANNGGGGYGTLKVSGKRHEKLRLSTAGWSGNEDIICALQENTMVWTLTWQSLRSGGHYEFRLPKNQSKQKGTKKDAN